MFHPIEVEVEARDARVFFVGCVGGGFCGSVVCLGLSDSDAQRGGCDWGQESAVYECDGGI